MKNFGIMILCISLAVSAFFFAQKGRYQVSTYEGSRVGLMPWMKYDAMTGRTWLMSDEGAHWIEVKDYGYAYTKPDEQKQKQVTNTFSTKPQWFGATAAEI